MQKSPAECSGSTSLYHHDVPFVYCRNQTRSKVQECARKWTCYCHCECSNPETSGQSDYEQTYGKTKDTKTALPALLQHLEAVKRYYEPVLRSGSCSMSGGSFRPARSSKYPSLRGTCNSIILTVRPLVVGKVILYAMFAYTLLGLMFLFGLWGDLTGRGLAPSPTRSRSPACKRVLLA